MKHWDSRDLAEAAPLRLPAQARRDSRLPSLVGLALAAGLLVGLVVMLHQPGPVAPELLP